MSSITPPRPPTDLELMMLADGELDAVRAREVAAAVERDPVARAKLASLGQVGESVRTLIELEVDQAEAELPELTDMWADVERRLAAEPARAAATATPAPTTDVVPTHRATRPPAAGEAASGWAAMRAWLSNHRGHFVSGLVSAGAVAALMFGLRQAPPAGGDGGDGAGDGRTAEVARPARPVGAVATPAGFAAPCGDPAASGAAAPTPPEVEDFEVYDGSGMVFTLPGEGEGDGAAAVIWIDTDNDTVEGPI